MQLIEEFLDYLKYEKRYSDHTIKAYRFDLINFKLYLRKSYESDLMQLNDEMIRAWMMQVISSGISKRTLNRKMSSIRGFYKYAFKTQLIDLNDLSVLKSFKINKHLPSIISKDEINYLLDNHLFENNYQGCRDKSILEMFYFTGIRLSELIGLKVYDLDFNLKQVKVLGKRSKERLIPLLDVHISHLKSYLECRSNAIDANNKFLYLTNSGDVLYPKLVYRIVNSYLSKVTGVKQKSPHVLRHAFATHMLDEGADLNAIKEVLGHSSLSSTQVYTSNSVERLKKIYEQAHPRGNKDGG